MNALLGRLNRHWRAEFALSIAISPQWLRLGTMAGFLKPEPKVSGVYQCAVGSSLLP